MLWSRKPEQPPAPAKDVTPWSGLDWTALANKVENQWHGLGGIADAFRRMVEALDVSERSATQLGKRIWWLTSWLLVCTVILTAAAVWPYLPSRMRPGDTVRCDRRAELLS